jgi:hypothetical protein
VLPQTDYSDGLSQAANVALSKADYSDALIVEFIQKYGLRRDLGWLRLSFAHALVHVVADSQLLFDRLCALSSLTLDGLVIDYLALQILEFVLHLSTQASDQPNVVGKAMNLISSLLQNHFTKFAEPSIA